MKIMCIWANIENTFKTFIVEVTIVYIHSSGIHSLVAKWLVAEQWVVRSSPDRVQGAYLIRKKLFFAVHGILVSRVARYLRQKLFKKCPYSDAKQAAAARVISHFQYLFRVSRYFWNYLALVVTVDIVVELEALSTLKAQSAEQNNLKHVFVCALHQRGIKTFALNKKARGTYIPAVFLASTCYTWLSVYCYDASGKL
jgi:hypothetical protein